MLEILVRQPPRPDDADNPIRRCYTGPSPDREHQLEIEARFGFEIVCGYALSESPYALVWRHGERPYGTLGSARQHPVLGHVNDARAVDDGRVVGAGRDRRARAAQPGDHARLLRDAGGDRGGDRRRLVAHRRPRARQRRRDLHVPRPQEGSDPPARREPVARRGRGRARTPSRRRRGGGDRRAVGPVGGRREGVRGRRARPRPPTSRRCTRSPREHLAAFKVPRYIELVDRAARTRRPTGWRSTSSRASAHRPKWTSRRRARAVSGR